MMHTIQYMGSSLASLRDTIRDRLSKMGRSRAGLPLRITLTAIVVVMAGLASRRLPRS